MIVKGFDCPICGEPTERPVESFGMKEVQTGPQCCENCGWVESRGEGIIEIDVSIFQSYKLRYMKNRNFGKLSRLM